MIFSFDEEPPISTIVWLDDQPFELGEVVDYTRADGSQSRLLRWNAACAQCGDHFEQFSPMISTGLSRRCVQHRKPGKPVKGKRGRRLKVRIEVP